VCFAGHGAYSRERGAITSAGVPPRGCDLARGVDGFGFGVGCLVRRVQSAGARKGVRVSGSGFKVSGVGLQDSGFGFQHSGLGLGSRVSTGYGFGSSTGYGFGFSTGYGFGVQ